MTSKFDHTFKGNPNPQNNANHNFAQQFVFH